MSLLPSPTDGYDAEMPKLRILYHHRTQGRGAEGNHIVSIVTAMRAAGHEVDVLSPAGVDPFDHRATIPVDEARTGRKGWSSVWRVASLYLPGAFFEIAEILYNIPAYIRLRRALRARAYDVLFERYAFYLMAGAFAARRSGCLFALEVNEVSGVADRVRKQHFPRMCTALERRIFACCDVGHAVSSYLGARIAELGLPPSCIVVAPNGFDVTRISITETREAMRARFNFQDCVVVGFAGWFVPWDRLDFLSEVFADAHRAFPSLRLCLVGEGEVARELVARLRGTPLADLVVLTGAIPRARVYDYVQMFDIGILPHSNLFGSPVVMFEMMGLKVPVIAPRLPPIEDVLVNGETALLFAPLDKDECTRQLLQLARSPDKRAAQAAAAFQKLNNEHTWIHTARKILAALPAGSSGNTEGWRDPRRGTEPAS